VALSLEPHSSFTKPAGPVVVVVADGVGHAPSGPSVNEAIETGDIWDSPTWQELLDHGRNATLHLIGLHSDGNVHSHTDHLYAIVHRAAADGLTRCRLHILLDGRDVAARSARRHLHRLPRSGPKLRRATRPGVYFQPGVSLGCW